MKNKIKQFAKGDFKLNRPDIVFPSTHLILNVGEGEVFQGEFMIENRKDGDIRGLVYPSSFRVRCLESGFEGNPVCVHFTFDSAGMVPGQVEQGKFTVVCNGGEYDLTYTAIVEKPYIMTAYGKVQTISDFKRLAAQDFEEAQKLFKTRQFYDVLKYEDKRILNLYDNIRKWSLDERALEEFLVGIKQKEKIFLTLSEEQMEYRDISEDEKHVIDVVKNTWGYVPIRIYAQGDFLRVGANEITTDSFVGHTYQLEYVICKEKLHAGCNYGKIFVETPYETLGVDITVHQYVKKSTDFGTKGMIAGQGLKEYLASISGKMDLYTWTEKALACVRSLRESEPDNEYYALLEAHVYLRARRDEEAKWILENGKFGKFAIGRKVEVSAYYLFLVALLRKDAASQTRALDEINRMYIKHPYSWQLLCMLVNLDPRYRDYSARIRVLERQFFNGSKQVLLYAEAYTCFQEKVLLLRKLDSFEIQVLNFATKYKIITKELAVYAAELSCQQRRYNKTLVRILERAYAMYEDNRILNALCMQLIKGNKIGSEYFKWYDRAVKAELKLAQLYEFYMMSMNAQRVKGAFPRIVYLYFRHGISLDYRRTALLYENILTYENENSEIYKFYQEQIKQFAKEQLLKRHINDSLRVIYNRFIRENEATLDEIEALYDICHKYHVTTSQKGMKYVLVIEKDGNVRQRVAYTEHGATVYLYDKESRIVWEGADGTHYTDSIPYDAIRMFYEMRFMELCKKRMVERADTTQKKKEYELTMDNLKMYGMNTFAEEDVFHFCTRQIREQENVEDDFLLYTCYELLKRDIYDKILLQYLAHYYCGATQDMKFVWKKAKEYGVPAKALAERIITQMLFSEEMFQEEEIFEDYYMGKPYFRLKQAYLASVSYQYVIQNREVHTNIFTMMLKEFREKEYLADVCMAALLKYFSDKQTTGEIAELLQGYLCELYEKQMVFAFYQNYPKEWLTKIELYDKYLVEYQGSDDAKVKIAYQIQGQEQCVETLTPSYANIYVKEFTLFAGESLEYYFVEEKDGKQTMSKKQHYLQETVLPPEGKYGKLNQIAALSEEDRLAAIVKLKQEDECAKILFPLV